MTRYRFQEIVINSTEKKKPTPEDKDRYIGLEHLDSGSLTVTRFGADVAPIGEKLLMKKGDVLFGKRRAYQKKVAIAPFDGIFSAHGMVLRPNEAVVTREFFPFFISSDYFLNAAIKISVGSLSPTINWRELKEVEFDLPSLEEQKRLADILWTAENLKESYLRLLTTSRDIVSSHFYEMFGSPFINERNWVFKPLKSVSSIISGSTPKTDVGKYWDGDIKWVTPAELSDDSFIITDTIRHITNEGVKATSSLQKLPIGTVLLSSRAPIGKIALCGVEMYCNQGFKNFICSDCLNPIYLFSILKMNTNYLQNLGSGSTFKEISKSVISEIMIIVPPIELQNEFANFIVEKDIFDNKLKETIESIKRLQVSIINHALEGS